ncbi:MAG: outer membrane lipoprotein carrier protein LolA [Firmicutes bacterium]|nr:outer membrane lipoprotein carrier protein LolA [Bacillota bacterium]
MKRWIVLVMSAALILTVLSGCGDKKTETGTPAQSGTQVQTQTQAPTPTPTGVDSKIAELANKAGQIKGMSFDMVMSSSSGNNKMSTTSKMYVSDKKSRIEMELMGVKMITIVNAQGDVYMYNPTDKTATKMPSSNASDAPDAWTGDASKMKVVGEENKDGFDCLVATVTKEGESGKIWLRKDIGMPVRFEQTISEGPVVAEFKNYQIGPQPDSLFEIPAGTKITTMPTTP